MFHVKHCTSYRRFLLKFLIQLQVDYYCKEKEEGDIVVTKRDLIIAVLSTFCLTATLFMTIPTRSTPAPKEYDPWCDVNGDGKVDIFDIVTVVANFLTTGPPINKTALLLYLNATVADLQSRINSLNTTLLDLEAQLVYINATLSQKIRNLESDIAILNVTKLGKPDYDSFEKYGGWKYIEPDSYWIFEHNLNTTNVLVYLIFRDNITENINQMCYGGEVSGLWYGGAWWCDLTNFTITVKRYKEGSQWNQVRVIIWKIPAQ